MAVNRDDVTITLTDTQIGQIRRATANGNGGLAALFAGLDDMATAVRAVQARRDDTGLSQSTLRALLLLAAFPRDGTYLTLARAAGLVGFSPSTAHRYASTWVAAGVLEQEAVTRRYRVVGGRGVGDGARGRGARKAGEPR
jgi:IclR helix-turn-helix domain